MSKTRPTGEQLRFRSSVTGDHILDDYLEAAEIGGRSLASLLGDLFDASGDFDTALFEFRQNPSMPGELQFRVGTFVDPGVGWATIGSFDLSSFDPSAVAITGGAIDGTPLGATTPSTGAFTTITATDTLTVTGTINGRDLAADGSKLDGIATGADVTGAVNVAAAGALMAANNLADLASAPSARASLGLVIGSDVQGHHVILDNTTASFTTALETKLNGIEASADVTDAANVTAAGALMESALASVVDVKALNQGVGTADDPSFLSLTLGTGAAPSATADDLSITKNTDDVGASLLAADSTGVVRVYFGSQSDTTASHLGWSVSTSVFTFQSGGALHFQTNGTNTRALIDSDGDMAIGFGSAASRLHVVDDDASRWSARVVATDASYTGAVLACVADRAANSGYDLGVWKSGGAGGDVEFRFSGNGNGTCDGSWSGGGADYAEYFEWLDGNPMAEDRRGLSVVLEGDKIRPAQPGETPIGVISGNPSVVGDADIGRWKNKYLKDDYGSVITEDYTTDEGVTQQRRKLNPAYDPDLAYVSRADRREWDMVGLMGKLRLRKGQPTPPSWLKMRDVSASVEEWLIR